jgi:putative ABC transport system permease protein
VLTWRRFFRRSRIDDEVARDLEFYLETETADNVARGMSPEEARAAARRKLGNPAFLREEVYCMNTAGFLDTVWQDLRYAYRVLRQSPAFTATAILSLALGIGGNTAVFTVVRGVLLKPLPYRDSGRLVKVAETDADTPHPETVDFTTTYDLRARSRSFESLSLFRNAGGALVGEGGSELLDGMRVNYDYFQTLGVHMQLGRAFLAEEDRPDRRYEVILTHGLWTRRFGADRQIIGRRVQLSDSSFTVVGVLPADFQPLARASSTTFPEFYLPLGYALGGDSACRGCQHLQLIGRLKPGVSVQQARQELCAVMDGVVREHPADYPKGIGVHVTPLLDQMVSRVSTAMWILLAAVALLLLMACANVANLVLARTMTRAPEMSLRAALGAGRGRLVRQLMLESALLGTASAGVGVALAWLATSALAQYGSRELPRVGELRIDATVLWFTCAVSLLTVALFGVMPALRASRVDLAAGLKDVGRTTDGRARHAFRRVLVTAELALAFVLLMGAGLLGHSFLKLTGVDPGYNPRNVLTMGMFVYGERYRKPEVELGLYRDVKDKLLAIPGVENVAMTSTLLLSGFDRRSVHIQDRPLANPSEAPSADTYSVTPDYFRTLRIPLKRGRLFTDADRAGAPMVALISESCARLLFPHIDPIGKYVEFGGRNDKGWAAIVGIVGDVRQYGLDQPSNMEVYLPQAQNVNFGYTLLVRTHGNPQRLSGAVRAAVMAVDPTQPVYHIEPLEAYLADTLATRAFTLALLLSFGGLALALAALGIYGVFSYAVTARTREVGIRMALGAGRGDVMTMMLRQGMSLVLVGLALGFGVSLLLARFLATLLYETGVADPATFSGAAVGLAAVGMLATYIPARRATRIDPMVALR